MKTISTTAFIDADRLLAVEIPSDVPLGKAEVVVILQPEESPERTRREQLLALAGSLSPADAEAFESAHRDCERIHGDDWQ